MHGRQAILHHRPHRSTDPTALATATPAKLARPAWMLLIALFIPWTVNLGGFALTPYRAVLLVMIGPALVKWASGQAGKMRLADLFILLFSIWSVVALGVIHGPQTALQPGGIQFVETMGGYMIARVYIRTADDFYAMGKLLFVLVAIFMPLALIESVTGTPLAMRLFSAILPGHPIMMNEPRLGFRRVQGVWEHPILFGVACGSALAITHLVLGRGQSALKRWGMSALIACGPILSLSSAPISSTLAQIMLIGWGWSLTAVKARWKILIALVALALLMVELFAKRSLPEILFSAFALDVQSAYFRLLIWNFGAESAANHPWFGVGYGRWDRPYWMPSSIDMFWLYNAVVYGIPAAIFMVLAFLSAIMASAVKPGLDERLYAYRTAFIVTMAAMFLVGWTVHFWNAIYVLFVFLMGSGIWLADAAPATERDSRAAQASRPPLRRQRVAAPGWSRGGAT